MRSHKNNPPENQLPQGLQEEGLIEAIKASGYPLQGAIAGELAEAFDVVSEEWGYSDRETGEHRSLDVIAHKKLCDGPPSKLEPWVVLLVECKRSRDPFVFFRSVAPPSMHEFPHIAGLPNDSVFIQEANGNRGRDATGAQALGLTELPFVASGPPICASFAKASPSGKKASLSGELPFKSLVLPLGKAFDHASRLFKAASSSQRIFARLTLCVGIVDAPMVVVDSSDRASDPVLAPWVRVVRQEANQGESRWDWYRFYYLDVVHSRFFSEYLTSHVLPFSEEYGMRSLELRDVLLTGGRVQDLDKWTWEELRLEVSERS